MSNDNSNTGSKGEGTPELPRGYKLTENFSIVDRHCGGAFGEVYFAIDTKYKQDVAIKIMPVKKDENGVRSDDNKWMVLEQTILQELKGVAHFPELVRPSNCSRPPPH